MKTTKLQNGIGLYCVSMGKIFRVTHVLQNMDDANKAMEQDRSTALIAEDNNGLCYLAQQYGSVCPSIILEHHQRQTTRRNHAEAAAAYNAQRDTVNGAGLPYGPCQCPICSAPHPHPEQRKAE